MEVLVTYVKTKKVEVSKEDEKFIKMADDYDYGKLSSEEEKEYDAWVNNFVDKLYSKPIDDSVVEITNIESETTFIYDLY